jgi:hypothetical protein
MRPKIVFLAQIGSKPVFEAALDQHIRQHSEQMAEVDRSIASDGATFVSCFTPSPTLSRRGRLWQVIGRGIIS